MDFALCAPSRTRIPGPARAMETLVTAQTTTQFQVTVSEEWEAESWESLAKLDRYDEGAGSQERRGIS